MALLALLRYTQDLYLLKLMWFDGLFIVSLVSVAIWTKQLAAVMGDMYSELPSEDFTEILGNVYNDSQERSASTSLFLHTIPSCWPVSASPSKRSVTSAWRSAAIFAILGALFQEVNLKDLLIRTIRYGDSPAMRKKFFPIVNNIAE